MKYFVLKINSISNAFQLQESKNDVLFKSTGNFFENEILSVEDKLLCFYDEPINEFRFILEVCRINDENEYTFKKIIDSRLGVQPSEEVVKRLENESIYEISRAEFFEIYKKLLSSIDYYFITSDDADDTNDVNVNDLIGINKIYYGIPGCGKSFHIEDEVLKEVDKEHDVFRTTFYLDYSNSDFIGQIYPVVGDDGSVSYEEKPGPFTKALERALRKPKKMIYLVIEEINRGNAAAIFGDTFQLLDRLKKDRDGRVAGDSEYPVNNEFIEGYFKKNNVPFKRRWDREKVMTDWNEVGNIKNLYIPYTDVTWEKFATTINDKMLEDNEDSDVSVSEDKQMGAYFVKENMLSKEKNTGDKDSLRAFISNVMDYLYNDVTKFNHELLFDKNVKTYDGLYETMTECKSVIDKEVDDSSVGAGKELFESVFKKEIVNELLGQEVDNEQGTNN